jgi:TIR domain
MTTYELGFGMKRSVARNASSLPSVSENDARRWPSARPCLLALVRLSPNLAGWWGRMTDDKQPAKSAAGPAKPRRSSIFISYRRDDTSGEAGHLAADLRKRFGREDVFIDIDTIAPGADFEIRINQALSACRVTFVLIGKHWLNATLMDGTRRLDHERDYVRTEIATALRRPSMDVVPVLVEGAVMPRTDQLPTDIADLAKRNAAELSNKRWRYDVSQLCAIAERHDRWFPRLLHRPRFWLATAGLVVLAGTAALVIASNGTGGNGTSGNRATLVPATVPPVVDECTHQLLTAVDGTVGPLKCPDNKINTLAWQYYAKFDPLVMTLGRFATEGQVATTLCYDLKNSTIGTIPKEVEAYQISALYYGWQFVLPPTLNDTISC